MKIIRAYRTALDPTTEQRKQLSRQAGAARFTYNWALARWRDQYEASKSGGEKPSAYGIHKALTPLKRAELPWLADVSAYVVREAVMDVGSAYKHFWRRLKEGKRGRAAGEPQFRSRNEPSGRGFRIAQPQAIDVREIKKDVVVQGRRTDSHPETQPHDRTIHTRTAAVKIAGVGWVKLHEVGYLPVGANYRGLACREVGGRWYVAVQVEEEREPKPSPRASERIGVEVGVRVLARTSDGHNYGETIDHLVAVSKADRRRKLWERRVARRYKRGAKSKEQSAGWKEAVRKVARLHARRADIRRDRLHQTTARIVRSGRGGTLILRDMQVSKMIGRAGKDGPESRTRNAIAPMVAGVGMYELRRQIEYKQRFRGAVDPCPTCDPASPSERCRTCGGTGVVQRVAIVPNDYPSTRTCSLCGVVRETDPGYPTWTCGACGAKHDREDNSARNLRDYDFAASSIGGGNCGRAARGKAAQAAERPAEPDHSAAEVSTTPPTSPDGGGAVSAALASLGSGNRAGGAKATPEKRGRKLHATGRAVSARHQSTSIPIEQRGDADRAPTTDQALESPDDGRSGDRSQVDPDHRENTDDFA